MSRPDEGIPERVLAERLANAMGVVSHRDTGTDGPHHHAEPVHQGELEADDGDQHKNYIHWQ